MTSIPLIEQLLLAEPTCRGPAQCKHSPWTIKGRVHSLEWGGSDTRTQAQVKFFPGLHNQYNSQVDVGCCHTLKYSILGCDYLLQYVHLSIEFSENFKDFSGNYSIYLRARSIYFII
jgi:hypothetical protein